ncbi:MAG: hypothetical protein KBS45_03410, partial [Clostridiales bacterium]|nr:hypothetical protein [Candidatus Coliplasma caballi]
EMFHTSVRATLDDHIGNRQFYEYREQKNGSCSEGGFYAYDNSIIDIAYYNAAGEQIGSAHTDGNNADLMCVRKGKKYYLAMRDGLHITVTDDKNNLVMRIEISGTQANIVEAGDNYRDDLDELLAIYNQFYMDD